MDKLSKVGGILLDLEGVLFVGDQVIDGAIETVRYLNEKRIPHKFVTNTTTKSRDILAKHMQKLGFDVKPSEILTAPVAACAYLRQQNPDSCYFLVADAVKSEFGEFSISETKPQMVVIGDIGPVWDYGLVNHLFRMLMSGADLVALHKSKYWQTPEGLQVDIGAFVSGLEYVTGKNATVIGKPSRAFFQAGIDELACPKEEIIMIGDDIDSDVGGAQRCGIRGVLVRTGKFRSDRASSVQPDATLDSVADLMSYL